MRLIETENIRLNVRINGAGPQNVVFIHGNLGCTSWFDLVLAFLSDHFRTFCIEWRGCGLSEKPTPAPDFSNYTIRQHAEDILSVVHALGIQQCELATHSTGGIISTHMLLLRPEVFNKVLALDPVAPMGMAFNDDAMEFFKRGRSDASLARRALAQAAPTLFEPSSLSGNADPVFDRSTSKEQMRLFDHLVDQAMPASEGVWMGTPIEIDRERKARTLCEKAAGIHHEHLVLWGKDDSIIPFEDIVEMQDILPNCRIHTMTNVGHSATLEDPRLYSEYFVTRVFRLAESRELARFEHRGQFRAVLASGREIARMFLMSS